MGLFLEEFKRGFSVATAGRTITEADIIAFAGLTGDMTELHTNEEYARATPFGRRIAHGALVFSISIGLTTRTNLLNDTVVAFSRVDHVRFTCPVFIGDTIRVTKRVLETTPHPNGRGMVAFETRVLNQRDEVVLAYIDRLVVKRRAFEGTAAEASAATMGASFAVAEGLG